MTNDFFLAFIPIFVAVDAIGVLPIFISLTEGLKPHKKNQVILHSVITAMILAVLFVFFGKSVFKFLGISVGDFMIAGGAILFCIAIKDLLSSSGKRSKSDTNLASVPLGTPLIVGPAVLTTSLILVSQYGIYITLASIVSNVLLAGVIFSASSIIIKIIGESGSKALSKVMSLLLAAIATMMIRKGLLLIFLPGTM